MIARSRYRGVGDLCVIVAVARPTTECSYGTTIVASRRPTIMTITPSRLKPSCEVLIGMFEADDERV